MDNLQDMAERAVEAQAQFEAHFDHKPKIDTRTPSQVKDQARRENWK